MNGMTVQERYDDICKKSGLSEEIVRRVISAERESLKESLIKGERATLMGICTLYPHMKTKLEVGGEISKHIRASATVSTSLANELCTKNSFVKQEDNTENEKGIRLRQIPSLI